MAPEIVVLLQGRMRLQQIFRQVEMPKKMLVRFNGPKVSGFVYFQLKHSGW